jgi:hypothetical protein
VENDIEEVRVFNDGSLYITNIQLKHAGNYTCHAQRNKDVVQTHIITVHSKFIDVSSQDLFILFKIHSKFGHFDQDSIKIRSF